MRIHIYVLLILCLSGNTFAQESKMTLEDLKPTYDENVFPNIVYKTNPRIEDKINTCLQLENLEHLPNQFRLNPFEKVAYGLERSYGSVYFHDYNQVETPSNIFSLMLHGDATGAYSEGFENYYNFDLRTGNKITLTNIFTENGIIEIKDQLNLEVKNTIDAFVAYIHEFPRGDDDVVNDQLDLYAYCAEDIEENSIDYYEYYFEKDSITFVRGRCSNHAMRAIDDLGSFTIKIAYTNIETFLSEYGKGLLSGESIIHKNGNPEGKFYKGTINNKYSITVFVSRVHSDNSLGMHYWYDKYRTPIEWDGRLVNNHFSLIEYDYYDEENQKWIKKATIEADIIGNNIIGTWENVESHEVFKLELTEY